MNEQELKEMIELLRQSGVEPMLCDYLVPLSDNGVVCGEPIEPGDDSWDDYLMLPKSLVGMHPEMFIPAVGDSMVGAGIEPGDLLRVRFGVQPHDGDNVLAWIDGRCTVKSLFTDEDGAVWLVPQNEDYDAIQVTEGMDVKILAVVIKVEKDSCRATSRQLLTSIRRTKNKRRAAKRLNEEEVNALIVRIAPEVVHARQWFAVMKAMVEYEVQTADDYIGFCTRVRNLLPEHTHLPEPKEISRMDVQSFSKPIAMWEETNAPVTGSRFRDYRRIALKMVDYLSEKR